ncbi:MAG: GAF and ANTAR domain-containing protein [Actinomycetia bacterium]|nr:GAF and ANTAR domain-containing protein [Actinomycetes bacterium]
MDVGVGEVTRALLAIARGSGPGRDLAAMICAACVDGLDVDGAAISLWTATQARETLHATDEVAQHLEDLQFTLGEGACIQAASTGRPVLVSDMHDVAAADQWPIFAAAVVERTPIRALLALPMQWGTINLGVLDLYRTTPGMLNGPQLRDATSASDTAGLLLLGQQTDPGDGHWLDHSVLRYAVVHQATGMVTAQLGISAKDAFARLRAHAFAEHRLLHDVAGDVVSRRLRFRRNGDL